MSSSNDASFNVEEYNDLIISGKHELTEGNLQDALELYSEALKMHYSEKLEKRVNNIKTKIKELHGGNAVEDEEPIQSDPVSSNIDQNKALLTNSQKQKYNEYILKGKLAQKDTNIEKALHYFHKAEKLNPSDKLASRISKLERYLSEENDNWFKDLGNGFFLPNEVYDKLYSYQHDGIKWMWNLYLQKQGGILGDDMGLGKTIQTIVFLQAMFSMEEISTAMLVMPLSLIPNWTAEFEKWAPELRVELYHGSKAERERNVKKVVRRGGIILTTYGIIEKNVEFLIDMDHIWNYLILDEGHKIKNPTRTSKAVRNIPCNYRLLISGTPIQNNLKELWALFDFVSRGTLLGTMVGFKMNYISPIERGREKDASKAEARLGSKLAENLRNLINPFFLRRTKAEVQQHTTIPALSNMGKKREICLWLSLSKMQKNLYNAFLTLDTVKDSMNQSKSPLAALTVLKKICDHPRLAIKFESIRELLTESNEDRLKELVELAELNDDPCNENLLEESCKLRFTLSLLKHLSAKGHRTLLFSTSLKILDFVQSLLQDEGLLSLRIDGRINKPGDRQTIIEKFNKDTKYSVFLLTTQVGGVGLNLTSADRVIIYDPNWNAATDSQAVDRAYRIGQTKPVTVYRLLSCGTIEEKIYRKQIFKDSISRQATGDCFDPIRYFTNQQIRQLFILGETEFSETCAHLAEYERDRNIIDTEREKDNAFLYDIGVIGCSNHDHVFEYQENTAVDTLEEQKFINDRIEFAKKSLQCDKNPAYDAKNMAIPLGGGMRQPWEDPGRVPSLFNAVDQHPEAELAHKLQSIEITENNTNNKASDDVIVINSDEEEDVDGDEVAGEVNEDTKKKISLSEYKKRQMKIYDFATPSKDLNTSHVLNETINNHIRNTSMKQNSENESEDEKETTMYDNLNKPHCLDESYEDSASENPIIKIDDSSDDDETNESGYNRNDENEKNELMISKLLDEVNLGGDHVGSGDTDECSTEQHFDGKNDKYVEGSGANLSNPIGVPCHAIDSEEGKNISGEAISQRITEQKCSDLSGGEVGDRDLQNDQHVVNNTPVEKVESENICDLVSGDHPDHEEKKYEQNGNSNEGGSDNNDTEKDSSEEIVIANDEENNYNVLQSDKENKFSINNTTGRKYDDQLCDNIDRTNTHHLEETDKHRQQVNSNKNQVIAEEKGEVKNTSRTCTCGRMSEAVNKGYTVTKCKCMCSQDELTKYKRYIDRGLEHHKSKNLQKAMQYYKAALQYRNDDTAVQKAYLNIKKELK